MNTTVGINAYRDVGLETSVLSADSHKLVSMLYQGALLAISEAKYEMQNHRMEAKGKAISKAISIIGEGLQASLDMKTGGEIAQNLFGLYGYMVKRLTDANINNDPGMLDEVTRLLAEIQGAWNAIRPQMATKSAAA